MRVAGSAQVTAGSARIHLRKNCAQLAAPNSAAHGGSALPRTRSNSAVNRLMDAAGNPVDGVTVLQVTGGTTGNPLDKSVTGTKGPGLAEFAMWKGGGYDVYVSTDGVNPSNSEIAGGMTSGLPDEAECSDGGGGNTLFHNSFNVIFRKNF